MRRISIIAVTALFSVSIAKVQDPGAIMDTWQKTIIVPASQDPIVEKLFTAWGKKFPGRFVDVFNEYKMVGNTITKDLTEFKVDFAPKNGFIEIYGTHSFTVENDGNFSKGQIIILRHILQAAYWNLPNGNKLFGISIRVDDEMLSRCGVFFYEYNATKETLTPRIDITQKVLSIATEEDPETFVTLPKEGRDLKYWNGVIKWNGNGF